VIDGEGDGDGDGGDGNVDGRQPVALVCVDSYPIAMAGSHVQRTPLC
jgi:hypothetical protein